MIHIAAFNPFFSELLGIKSQVTNIDSAVIPHKRIRGTEHRTGSTRRSVGVINIVVDYGKTYRELVSVLVNTAVIDGEIVTNQQRVLYIGMAVTVTFQRNPGFRIPIGQTGKRGSQAPCKRVSRIRFKISFLGFGNPEDVIAVIHHIITKTAKEFSAKKRVFRITGREFDIAIGIIAPLHHEVILVQQNAAMTVSQSEHRLGTRLQVESGINQDIALFSEGNQIYRLLNNVIFKSVVHRFGNRINQAVQNRLDYVVERPHPKARPLEGAVIFNRNLLRGQIILFFRSIVFLLIFGNFSTRHACPPKEQVHYHPNS